MRFNQFVKKKKQNETHYADSELKLKNTKSINFVLASVLIGFSAMFADAVLDYLLFYEYESFIDILVVNVDSFEFYFRLVLLASFIFFGIIIQILLNKKNNLLNQLKISEAKLTIQNKELVIAKERAEESDHLKSAFLSNMSHEIRTPMNSILGFSALLRKRNLPPEKKEKYLELIDSGGNRLLRLISDIVEISKIDATQLSLNYAACNLNKLIDNLLYQFSLPLKGENVILKANKTLSDDKSYIQTDEVRLIQIISNLIENAQKFTKEGEIEFGYYVKKELIEFYVRDTGIGIEDKDFKIIFERFRQTDNEFARFREGTGLGLSIVKGLVDIFKGEIRLESKIGEGTTFYFNIPYLSYTPVRLDREKDNIQKDFYKANAKLTILIVEDNDINFIYLEELFEKYYYLIIRAHNGEEAVKLVNENSNIDLVFMDIKLPVMSGIEATIEIRKTNKEIPIIALTAYAMPEDRLNVINAGCNGYLAKPISEEEIISVIKKYIK